MHDMQNLPARDIPSLDLTLGGGTAARDRNRERIHKVAHIVSPEDVPMVAPVIEGLRRSSLGSRYPVVTLTRDELLGCPEPWDAVVVHDPCTVGDIPSLGTISRRWHTILVDHRHSDAFEQHNIRFQRFFEWMLRWSYGLVDTVAAVSEAQAAWMRRRDLVAGDRLVVVPPTVSPEPFGAVSDRYHTHSTLSLGVLGHADQPQAMEQVVHALKDRPGLDCKLYLMDVTAGHRHRPWQDLAAADARIEPMPENEDLPAFFERCDAVICPSLWEPEGLECIEARAAGRPVLVPDVDALPEQAADCGLVFHDMQELGEALEHLEPVSLTEWSHNARRGALAAYETGIDRWTHLLDDAAKDTSRLHGFECDEMAMENDALWVA